MGNTRNYHDPVQTKSFGDVFLPIVSNRNFAFDHTGSRFGSEVFRIHDFPICRNKSNSLNRRRRGIHTHLRQFALEQKQKQ